MYVGSINTLKIRTGIIFLHSLKTMKKEKPIQRQESMHSLKEVKVKKENIDSCENDEKNGLQIVRIIQDYEKKWLNLQVSKNDLQLKYCFLIGQEFCYKEIMEDMYIGLVNNCVFLFKQTDDTILYQCLYDSKMIYLETCTDPYMKPNGRRNCTNIPQDVYIKELYEFFNLHFPLQEHIEIWKKKDKRMKEISDTLHGLRLLKLDPTESFFSFICSSNNNIPRITLMNECLRKRYGTHIATIIFEGEDILVNKKGTFDTNKDTVSCGIRVKQEKNEKSSSAIYKDKKTYVMTPIKNESNTLQIKREKENKIQNIKRRVPQKGALRKKMKMVDREDEQNFLTEEKKFYQLIKKERKEENDIKIYSFYEFPTIETLSKLEEQNLRDMGFGYRSTFIISSAKMLKNYGAEKWLQDLKKEQHTIDCIKKLIQFPGVGLKVANCICLFGLHRYDCIPIDTHIYDIIHKYYKHLIDDLETGSSPKKRNSNRSIDDDVKKIKKGGKGTEGRRTSVTNGITNGIKMTVPAKKPLITDKEKKKALTHSVYAKLFKGMRNIFGPNCGWAQTMLFIAELKKFNDIFT